MGISRKGILGGVSGSVGPVVGVIRKNKNILRSKPRKIAKSKRIKTPEKIGLGLISEFLSLFTAELNLGYAKKGSTSNPFNRAIQYNVKNAIIGTDSGFKLDYSKIVFSKGNLEPAWSARMANDGSTLLFSWEIPASVKLKLVAKDIAHIMTYNETGKKHGLWSGTANRDQLSTSIPLHGKAGDVFHAWIFFVSPDEKSVSNSEYMGSIIA